MACWLSAGSQLSLSALSCQQARKRNQRFGISETRNSGAEQAAPKRPAASGDIGATCGPAAWQTPAKRQQYRQLSSKAGLKKLLKRQHTWPKQRNAENARLRLAKQRRGSSIGSWYAMRWHHRIQTLALNKRLRLQTRPQL
jgi:hypothetical protein